MTDAKKTRPPAAALAALIAAAALAVAPFADAAAQPAGRTARPLAAAPAPEGEANRIVAVVNGDVVTRAEVRGRARLFAFTSGLGADADLARRIEPQITRLLVEDRLKLQEIQRRRVPVTDEEVAAALADIEARNGLPPGGLLARLREARVEPRVLYDQIRVQIGWQRVVRGLLGPQGEPSEAEVAEQVAAHNARVGQPEFLVSEIFVPLDDPAQEAETRRFVEEVVGRLRAGLPFPVAATQFSQAQTALAGGDLGWVRPDDLEPEVARIVTQMPQGAISSAVRVPGGFRIVALRQRREIGREIATIVTLRQAFLPFTAPLDPQNPTEQQRTTLARAQAIRGGCEAVEAAARGGPRPADPGPVRLETLQPPALRQLVAAQAVGRASGPVVTPEGILVIAVCSREQRNLAEYTPDMARAQLVRDRAENVARQQARDLRRRAQIEMRDAPAAVPAAG